MSEGKSHTLQPEEIESLTRDAAAGDREALERLLTMYLPSLRAFVRSRLGRVVRDRESSSDVAQSVCREVLQQAETFRFASEGAFKRWLFRMAIRKLDRRRDYLLAEKRDVLRNEHHSGDDAMLARAYESFGSPSQHAMAREGIERIEAALDQLSPEHRQVIVLTRFVGMTHAEIAADLDKSEVAVRMLLHRALAHLAVHIQGQSS